MYYRVFHKHNYQLIFILFMCQSYQECGKVTNKTADSQSVSILTLDAQIRTTTKLHTHSVERRGPEVNVEN